MSEDRIERTPLYEEHVALGARMVPFAGWEMPVQYTGIVEEHAAVRSKAGVFDVCHMAELRVFGLEAEAALQGLLTNDLGRLDALGAAQYTLLCDDDGGIIDDLIVYRTGDAEFLIVANAGNRSEVFEWLSERLPRSVELADESRRTALIALQGPEAPRILAELIGNGGSGLPERFCLGPAQLAGTPVLLSRTGYTGEDGAEALAHVSHAVGLWRAMLSFPEVMPCGLGARDVLRLEMGYPLHGSDIDRTTDPISARLGWVVDLDKGDFVGRDAIAAVKERGPERRLIGLTVPHGQGVPRHGYAVLRGDEEVGVVTSGTFSPTLDRGIALAYVPSDLATPGTELAVAMRKRVVPAVVTRPPFVTGTSLRAS
jgi:aminomethyltransferase